MPIAVQLYNKTLDDVRRLNDKAVAVLWQPKYKRPLVDAYSKQKNITIEKRIERLAWIAKDYPNKEEAKIKVQGLLKQLEAYSISPFY